MKITLIGAGNLATNIGLALHSAGHIIVQVYSRQLANASCLSSRLGATAIDQLDKVNDLADIYIFSLKDSVLQSAIEKVCKHNTNKVFLHTAGSMNMQLFEGYATCFGVLYPMQTFSKDRPVDFKSIPCFIEASDSKTLECIQSLALSVSEKVYMLSSHDRKYLHLSAVFACNFVNHCYEIAAEILHQHDIPFEVLQPLIDETARKIHMLSPRDAQTGPAVRYDKNVIEAQRKLLADSPLWQEIYERMSASIHRTAITNKPNRYDKL